MIIKEIKFKYNLKYDPVAFMFFRWLFANKIGVQIRNQSN